MAEPARGKKRAEPFGQRASAHVHVHAHTLASQGGLRSLLSTTTPALLEVASVEDSVQNRDGRPASDPPRWGNSSEPQIRQIFQDVDGSDLEALTSLCVQWEVDLSASIAEQNARIDRRKISRSQRQKEMGQLRDSTTPYATASSARWSPPGSD